MKRTLTILGMTMLSSILIVSCTKENGGDGTTGSSGTPGPLFSSVKSMMQTNCAISGCHVSPNPQNGLDFSVDNTIVAQKDRIKVRAVDNAGTFNQMPLPPRPALSAADQKKITDWISAGGRLTD
jgi:uncharacterized membrane protein